MTNEFAFTSQQPIYGDPHMVQGIQDPYFMSQEGQWNNSNQWNPNQKRFIGPALPFLGGLLLGSVAARPYYWYRPYPRPYPYYPYIPPYYPYY